MPEVHLIHPDRYCVHQVTLMEQCNFRESIECFSRHGIHQAAIWRQKLETVGEKEAAAILEGNGVTPAALCAAVLMEGEDGQYREGASVARSIERNRRLIEQAVELGAPSVIVITGGLFHQDLASARSRSIDLLGELVPYAKAANVQLILEPLHPMVCGNRSVISTLGEAMQMLDAINPDAMDDTLGIALDTYALWWQGDLEAQIPVAGKRIRHFHVSDWLPDTNDVRLDRGMPGDGLINNRQIRQWLEATGFDGAVEVEIFSQRNWWKQNPDDVLSVIRERYATCL